MFLFLLSSCLIYYFIFANICIIVNTRKPIRDRGNVQRALANISKSAGQPKKSGTVMSMTSTPNLHPYSNATSRLAPTSPSATAIASSIWRKLTGGCTFDQKTTAKAAAVCRGQCQATPLPRLLISKLPTRELWISPLLRAIWPHPLIFPVSLLMSRACNIPAPRAATHWTI